MLHVACGMQRGGGCNPEPENMREFLRREATFGRLWVAFHRKRDRDRLIEIKRKRRREEKRDKEGIKR